MYILFTIPIMIIIIVIITIMILLQTKMHACMSIYYYI